MFKIIEMGLLSAVVWVLLFVQDDLGARCLNIKKNLCINL